MTIIECTKCGIYYITDDCYYRQTAADDYIYRCPEGHDLEENEIEDMGDALDELNYLMAMINRRDKTIKGLQCQLKQ